MKQKIKFDADSTDMCIRIDITDRKKYLEVLEKVRKLTQKIVIVQIDGPIKNDPIVNTAWNLLHLEKKEIVSRWYGTIAEGSRAAVKHTFSTIRNRREFFGFLSSLDSFWDGIEALTDEYDPRSRFDDIAFLDEKGRLLFYSTTHEEDFYINKDLV